LNEPKKELGKQNLFTIIISCVAIFVSVFAIIFSSIALIQKTDEQLFDENINKVVEIRVSNDEETWGLGTGCFISSDGTILTNKHMVYSSTLDSNYSTIQVRLPSSEEYVDATVLNVSSDVDLALIKIDKNNCEYFNVVSNVTDGQEIYTIGNPNGFGLSFTKGNVSSRLRYVTYEDNVIATIQTSLVINEGNSGGPVFNKNGELLGLISFRLKDKNNEVIQGVSFAVPGSIILEYLDSIEAE